MAIFPRRAVAKALACNQTFCDEKTHADWVKRLNTISVDYLATEWEIILIALLSELGEVEHEPNLGDAQRIDVVFSSHIPKLAFAAEIVTVSDRAFHEDNPVQAFLEELQKRVMKAGVVSGGFVTRLNESQPSPSRGSKHKRRILIPQQHQFGSHVFNKNFADFLNEISAEPECVRSLKIVNQDPQIDVLIQYQPGRRGSGSTSYGAYTSTTIRDRNPVYKALKRKADQLRGSSYKGVRGIIACDGDSRLFTAPSNWAEYKLEEVVQDFLRKNTSIDFVLTLAIRSNPQNFGGGFYNVCEPKLHVREEGFVWLERLSSVFETVVKSLPRIVYTPMNAQLELKRNEPFGHSHLLRGGLSMSSRKVSMSSRELLNLLSGRLEQAKFLGYYKSGNSSVFEMMLNQGRLIRDVRLEKAENEDDDLVVLEFGDPDPAIWFHK